MYCRRVEEHAKSTAPKIALRKTCKRESDNEINDVLRTLLQQAIEVEWATMPLYMYGYVSSGVRGSSVDCFVPRLSVQYSLDKAKNGPIADVIHSVFMEEMLHFSIAGNTLIALGGHPVIDATSTPKFPTTLPGGLVDDFQFHLRPFSMDQLEQYLRVRPGFARGAGGSALHTSALSFPCRWSSR